jgi:hypothetical protein
LDAIGLGLDTGDLGSKEFSDPDASGLDADQGNTGKATVALDNLVCHPSDCSAHVVRTKHLLASGLGRLLVGGVRHVVLSV